MAGIPALTGDPRAAMAQALLMQGSQGGNDLGSGLRAAGQSIIGAVLARQVGAARQRRQQAIGELLSSAAPLLSGAGAGGAMGGTAPAPSVASAGGAGFSTGSPGATREQIVSQLLASPEMLNDPRAQFVLQQLTTPAESDVVSPEREAQLIRLADARRQPASVINVGPQGQQFGKPPDGTEWARNQDGSIMVQQVETPGGGMAFSPVAIPIIGGPVEAAQAEAAAAQAAREEGRQTQADLMTEEIERAKQLIINPGLLPNTGAIGALLSNVGGTDAGDLGQLLTTIRANIGFDRLQQMREQSPTGGALGNITEGEVARLEAVQGSLAQSQSQEQLLFNLDRLARTFNEIVHGNPEGPVAATERTTITTPEGAATQTQTVQEGATATNPQTGERIILRNGQWVPFNG